MFCYKSFVLVNKLRLIETNFVSNHCCSLAQIMRILFCLFQHFASSPNHGLFELNFRGMMHSKPYNLGMLSIKFPKANYKNTEQFPHNFVLFLEAISVPPLTCFSVDERNLDNTTKWYKQSLCRSHKFQKLLICTHKTFV